MEFSKSLQWTNNKWNGYDLGHGIDLSPDGLTIFSNGQQEISTVRAIHSAFPPVTDATQPIQLCYFETKNVRDFTAIGFCKGDLVLDEKCWHGGEIYGHYSDGTGLPDYWQWQLNTLIVEDGAVVGCGLLKHTGTGKRRIFHTNNGILLASVPIPSSEPDQLFPVIAVDNHSRGPRFEETNFGLKPFLFEIEGNEEKLLNGLGRDFEMDEE